MPGRDAGRCASDRPTPPATSGLRPACLQAALRAALFGVSEFVPDQFGLGLVLIRVPRGHEIKWLRETGSDRVLVCHPIYLMRGAFLCASTIVWSP